MIMTAKIFAMRGRGHSRCTKSFSASLATHQHESFLSAMSWEN
jgi:hypothetical protein